MNKAKTKPPAKINGKAETQPQSPRGRPRSQEVHKTILLTALRVLSETGFAGFTINEVVQRSGVSSATIYRRWSSSEDLLLDAINSLGPDPHPIDLGSFKKDIENFIDELAQAVVNFGTLGALRSREGKSEEIRKRVVEMFVTPRMAMLQTILKNALSRGEIDNIPCIEDCWTIITGPIQQRVYFDLKPFSPEFVAMLKAVIVAGIPALAATSIKKPRKKASTIAC